MRHTDNHLVDTKLCAAFKYLFDQRNHRFTTIKTETLGACVFSVQILLKDLRLRQALQNCPSANIREIRAIADAFDPLLNPGLLLRLLDMHELNADLAAIGLLKNFDDLAQRGAFHTDHVVDEDGPVHIGVGKTV